MEARISALFATAARRRPWLLLSLLVLTLTSMGAAARSRNFIVQTGDPALDRQIADAAERYRRDLAVAWLGQPMRDWAAPCVMTVRIGENLGAGGATTFMFDRGEVFGWRMNIQGPRQRIFDSVLPHEVTHMVLATHFRRPLPRWADEGAATSAECAAEREKHYRMLWEFLHTRRGIAFATMFALTEYPPDVMPLYAQGFALADYLIQQGGRRKFLAFLEDGMETRQWSAAVARHYDTANLGQLQDNWLAWIRDGHQPLQTKPMDTAMGNNVILASAAPRDPNATSRTAPPARLTRAPGGQLTAAGRRPWPQSNLIHYVPRVAATADQTPAKTISASTVATAAPDDMVPIIRPEQASPAPTDTCPTCVPCSQMARPQPPEAARQIILEWNQSAASAGIPMCGQPALLR